MNILCSTCDGTGETKYFDETGDWYIYKCSACCGIGYVWDEYSGD